MTTFPLPLYLYENFSYYETHHSYSLHKHYDFEELFSLFKSRSFADPPSSVEDLFLYHITNLSLLILQDIKNELLTKDIALLAFKFVNYLDQFHFMSHSIS